MEVQTLHLQIPIVGNCHSDQAQCSAGGELGAWRNLLLFTDHAHCRTTQKAGSSTVKIIRKRMIFFARNDIV
jgi:hypothetical protein